MEEIVGGGVAGGVAGRLGHDETTTGAPNMRADEAEMPDGRQKSDR